MIQKPNRQHQICNVGRIVFAILFSLVLSGICENNVYALNNDDKNLSVDYSKFNTENTKNTADELFRIALETQDTNEKTNILSNAAAKYYILTNIDNTNIYPCIQLARIYDLQENDAYAKSYFYRALGMNYKNVDANFYFAEFYYTRKQYKKALEYYQNSINYGKEPDAVTLKKIGQIYERFGDIQKASYYYKKSLALNPQDEELPEKINENANQEYEKSGYYKRRLRN